MSTQLAAGGGYAVGAGVGAGVGVVEVGAGVGAGAGVVEVGAGVGAGAGVVEVGVGVGAGAGVVGAGVGMGMGTGTVGAGVASGGPSVGSPSGVARLPASGQHAPNLLHVASGHPVVGADASNDAKANGTSACWTTPLQLARASAAAPATEPNDFVATGCIDQALPARKPI